MISPAQERSHLLLADSHLLECREHIRRQIKVVRHQRSMGWDDQASLELLHVLRSIQVTLRAHRAIISSLIQSPG